MTFMRFLVSALLATPLHFVAAQAAQPPLLPSPDSIPYLKKHATVMHLINITLPRYSDDGSWLVFQAERSGQTGTHVFAMPAAGGDPIQLSSGAGSASRPVFLSQRRGVAYYASNVGAVVTTTLNPRTMRPTGAPRRVTVDSTIRSFDVTPDGRFVAYVQFRTMDGSRADRIMVVAAGGGVARQLFEAKGTISFPRFDREGRWLYFVNVPASSNGIKSVARVSVAGGNVESVMTVPAGYMGVAIDAVAERVLVRQSNIGHVLTLRGDTVSRFTWANGVRSVDSYAFAPAGTVLLPTTDETWTLQIVPLSGGAPRSIMNGTLRDWLDHWVGDRIYYESDDLPGYAAVTTAGRRVPPEQMDFVVKPAPTRDRITILDGSPDDRYWLISVMGRDAPGELHMVDRQTRTAKLVHSAGTGGGPNALAGSYRYRSAEGFFFLVPRGDSAEVHTVTYAGATRRVATLPDSLAPLAAMGTKGLAYPIYRGDSTIIMYVSSGGTARRAIAVAGTRLSDLSFSANGAAMFAVSQSGTSGAVRAVIFAVGSDGAPTRATRTVDLDADLVWEPTWLPGGEAVLMMAEKTDETMPFVLRIPVAGTARAVRVTQRVTGSFMDYLLSPDGTAIAVFVRNPSGSTFWNLDLTRAAASHGVRVRGRN